MTEEEFFRNLLNDRPLDSIFKHFKGGYYKFCHIAKSSIDKSEWVVYLHLWPNERQFWIRPKEEFFGYKDNVKRFKIIQSLYTEEQLMES